MKQPFTVQVVTHEAVALNSSTLAPTPTIYQLITEKQVCAYLNVSKRNLYCWRMAGLIPYLKIGRAVRYRPADVEATLKRMTAQHEPKP
jgi:excisionase family DNA binding protein